MGWWAVSAARAVLADPARARERQRTWTLAQGRAASWLARAHPQAYRDCYQQALAEVRAKEPGLPGGRAHERASRQARAELSAVFADEYAARFDQELAVRLPLRPSDRAPRRRRALAWVRVLDALRRQRPDQFERRYRHELAREGQPR